MSAKSSKSKSSSVSAAAATATAASVAATSSLTSTPVDAPISLVTTPVATNKVKRTRKPKAVTVAATTVGATTVGTVGATTVGTVAATTVGTAAATTTTISVEGTETGSIEGIESEFLSLATRLQELKTLQMSVVSDLKKLHKTVHRHMKENSKKHKKRKNLDPNRPKRAPSGFAKPALISVELCSFLGKPEGTEMARTEVTKYLTQYIKEHKLQDEANRRKILPNKPLQQLLNVGQGDEVTYFNLQKYMKVHFPKSAVLSA